MGAWRPSLSCASCHRGAWPNPQLVEAQRRRLPTACSAGAMGRHATAWLPRIWLNPEKQLGRGCLRHSRCPSPTAKGAERWGRRSPRTRGNGSGSREGGKSSPPANWRDPAAGSYCGETLGTASTWAERQARGLAFRPAAGTGAPVTPRGCFLASAASGCWESRWSR